MGVRRWILAILVALYAAQSAMVAAWITSLKFGWVKARGDMVRLAPLADSASVLQLGLDWAAIALFFASALRLVQRKPAFNLFAGAFFLSMASWLMLKMDGAYDRVFSRSEQDFDYVLIAVLILIGFGTWLIERARAAK